MTLRIISFTLYAAGCVVALMATVRLLPSVRMAAFNYAILILLLSQFGFSGSVVSNDAMAVFGGSLAIAGGIQSVMRLQTGAFVCMLAGLVIASLAKLTGLLLCGVFVGFCLCDIMQRQRMILWHWLIAMLAYLIALFPYFFLTIQYGAPAPSTTPHLAMQYLAANYTLEPKVGFLAFMWDNAMRMVSDVMRPKMGATPWLSIGVNAGVYVLGLIGVILALVRGLAGQADAWARVVAWGCISIIFLWFVSMISGYQRYIVIGLKFDTSVRYFYPMAPIVVAAMVRSIGAQVALQRYLAFCLAIGVVILYSLTFAPH